MLLFGDVEKLVLINGGRRSFSLELEDHDSIVMAGGE